MSQNLQYFQAYCAYNSLPFDESWLSVAQQSIKQEKKLISYSRWSYLFEGFDAYCSGEMDMETFMTMGDGVNEHAINQKPLAAYALAHIKTQLAMDEDFGESQLFVVDERATYGYTVDDVRGKLASRGAELYVVSMGLGVDQSE